MMLGNAPKLLRGAFVGALALIAAAQASYAQQQGGQSAEAPVLVAGTVDCRYQVRPMETVICSTPVLAAMDIQMITLYNVLNLLVKPEVGADMAASQQAFLKSRENCGTDSDCIGKATIERIGQLDAILKDIVSRGPY